jgi:hypothetical protein
MKYEVCAPKLDVNSKESTVNSEGAALKQKKHASGEACLSNLAGDLLELEAGSKLYLTLAIECAISSVWIAEVRIIRQHISASAIERGVDRKDVSPVCYVERLGEKLKRHALGKAEPLREANIDVNKSGQSERVPSLDRKECVTVRIVQRSTADITAERSARIIVEIRRQRPTIQQIVIEGTRAAFVERWSPDTTDHDLMTCIETARTAVIRSVEDVVRAVGFREGRGILIGISRPRQSVTH